MAQQTKTKRSSSSSAKSGSKSGARSARPASEVHASGNGSPPPSAPALLVRAPTKRTTRSRRAAVTGASRSRWRVADTAKDGARLRRDGQGAAKGAKVPAMLAGAGSSASPACRGRASQRAAQRVRGVATVEHARPRGVSKNLAERANVGRFGEGMGRSRLRLAGCPRASGGQREDARSPIEAVRPGLTNRVARAEPAGRRPQPACGR